MSNLKYKVGDKVRIKDIDWYNENKNEHGYVYCGERLFYPVRSKLCGEIFTISEVFPNYYLMSENEYEWTDEMIECQVEEENKSELVPYFEEGTNKILYYKNKNTFECYFPMRTPEYICPEGYIFKDENGNEINAQKIVLEKKTVEEKYSDVKIQIFGNVVILKGGINADNPTEYMNEVVEYILNLLGKPKYNQFIEDYLDNPWVRILIFDFNSMKFNNSFDDIVNKFN